MIDRRTKYDSLSSLIVGSVYRLWRNCISSYRRVGLWELRYLYSVVGCESYVAEMGFGKIGKMYLLDLVIIRRVVGE